MTSTLIIVIVSYGDDTFSDTMTMITVMKRKLNMERWYAWKELLSFGPQLGL